MPGYDFTVDKDNCTKGDYKRFCEARCHSEGVCTETVKQSSCGCKDGNVNDTCATIEYKVLQNKTSISNIE